MIFHYFSIFMIMAVNTDVIYENLKYILENKVEKELRYKRFLMVSIRQIHWTSVQKQFQNRLEWCGPRQFKLYITYIGFCYTLVFPSYFFCVTHICIPSWFTELKVTTLLLFCSHTLDKLALVPHLNMKFLVKGKIRA